jgi:hypothetical protein
MASLMTREPDPEKQHCRVKNANIEVPKLSADWVPHDWFLEQGRSQTKEMPQVEPKLPSWGMLMRPSATREFLADEELDPPLLGWSSLLD